MAPERGSATADAALPLRPMQRSDVGQVATLQSELLKGSAVTDLGIGFLTRFYSVALACEGSEAFTVSDRDGRLVGAVLGSADVARFNAYVTPRIAPWLAASLSVRWGLAYRFARGVFEQRPSPLVNAELLLLFVDGARQRAGTGTRLVRALEAAFVKRGVMTYRVAFRSEIAAARAFYLANGFAVEDELIVLGRPMTYLTKRLTP